MSQNQTTPNRLDWHRLLWTASEGLVTTVAWAVLDWRAAAFCLVMGIMGYIEGTTRNV